MHVGQNGDNVENETKTKRNFWKGVLVGALVTMFAGMLIVGMAAAILVIGRSVMQDGLQGQIVESSGAAGENGSHELDYRKVQAKLDAIQGLVDSYYLFDEDMDKVEAGIYKGMLSGLEDPYTIYYTPEEYQALTEETEGVYCGIGALVSQNLETKLVTILRVFPGSPAEEAGLLKGDILYSANGIEAMEADLDVLVQQEIRGEEGTVVKLKVIRDGKEMEFSITRRVVEVSTVEHQMLENNTGYIMVTQFDVVTAQQFENAVDDLTEQGMERLVIDLRDNPGGVLDAVVEMAAYVLPEDKLDGTLISTADKNGKGCRYYSKDGMIRYESNDGQGPDPRYPKEDGHELDIPIAVLVNGNSASAAEVFAGALQDYDAAELVGTTTFGKGIVQSLIQLDDGSAVKLTTSHYYTPSGFDLHKKGLEPDVEVELEIPEDADLTMGLPLEQDNQIQKALEVLE